MSFDVIRWSRKNREMAKLYMIECGKELWEETQKNSTKKIGPKKLYSLIYDEVRNSIINNLENQ